MGLIKAFVKLSILLTLGAIVTGVVFLVQRPKDQTPTSFEEWPSVPQNPRP